MNYYFVQQYDIGFIGLRLDNINVGIEWIYFCGTTKAETKKGVIPFSVVEKLCQRKYLTSYSSNK